MNKKFNNPIYVIDKFGQKRNTQYIFCIEEIIEYNDYTPKYMYWTVHKKYKSLGSMIRAYIQLNINRSKGLYKSSLSSRSGDGIWVTCITNYRFRCQRYDCTKYINSN